MSSTEERMKKHYDEYTESYQRWKKLEDQIQPMKIHQGDIKANMDYMLYDVQFLIKETDKNALFCNGCDKRHNCKDEHKYHSPSYPKTPRKYDSFEDFVNNFTKPQ